jgi:hypothetical protein
VGYVLGKHLGPPSVQVSSIGHLVPNVAYKECPYGSPFLKHFCPHKPLLNPCDIRLGFLLVNLEVLTKSSLQVLESPNDQHHADGSVECCCIDASKEPIGDDSNATCLNASHTSRGVALVLIHPQVASQGTGVVNIYDADKAMY